MIRTIDKTNSTSAKTSRLKSHAELSEYIKQMQDGKPNRNQEARTALIRSGVLKKNGEHKDRIVSWE